MYILLLLTTTTTTYYVRVLSLFNTSFLLNYITISCHVLTSPHIYYFGEYPGEEIDP